MAVQKGSTENFAQFFVTHSIQTHETRTMGGLVVSIGLFLSRCSELRPIVLSGIK